MALNEAEMKAGDVVRLNASGQNMAIEGLFTPSAGQAASYVWFTQDWTCLGSEFLCCMLVVAPFIDSL
jgi:hypothetical protein